MDSRFTKAWSLATGREQRIPKAWLGSPRLMRGLTLDAPPVADDGQVDLDTLTVADLKDRADKAGIDLGGATKKADIVAAITAATTPTTPAQPGTTEE